MYSSEFIKHTHLQSTFPITLVEPDERLDSSDIANNKNRKPVLELGIKKVASGVVGGLTPVREGGTRWIALHGFETNRSSTMTLNVAVAPCFGRSCIAARLSKL